jgi:2-polyprenyl-3-methyl-5-hydroxy-6-metoxy-1,4-benzoquinol methylase
VDSPSPERFFDAVNAYQQTAALRAAVHLDLFTALDEGEVGGPGDAARTVPGIAKRCAAPERGLRVLCDYLVIVGFLRKIGERYELTPDSAMFLSRRSPAYLGTTVDFLASPEMMRNFDTLADTIRRGTIAPANNNTVADDNPIWVQFARAMGPMMMPRAHAIADALGVLSAGPGSPDTHDTYRVLDIAAGHGLFGIVLAQNNPRVEVVAVDWAAVLEVARDNAARMGVGDRYRLLPGDAFKVDYGAGFDVALVTNFLHHFDRATCVAFMRRVAAALKPGGRAAVLEFVPNDDRISPPMAAAFSLTMLAGTPGGAAYTLAELRGIALEAGFASVTAHAAPPQTIVVATR